MQVRFPHLIMIIVLRTVHSKGALACDTKVATLLLQAVANPMQRQARNLCQEDIRVDNSLQGHDLLRRNLSVRHFVQSSVAALYIT